MMYAFVTIVVMATIQLFVAWLTNYLLYRHRVKNCVEEFEKECKRIHEKQ